jgi:putative chitinase
MTLDVAAAKPRALINAAQLRLFAPHCNYVGLAPMLDREARRCAITTPRRIRHWLAHLHHESQGFTCLEESLNYSVKGLRGTFGRHRISDADCERYGRIDRFDANGRKIGVIRPADQRAIANIVYGGEFGRKNLGNIREGDGYLFRGGGWIQQTGRGSHARASEWTGIDLVKSPQLGRTPQVATVIAADFWRVNGLNAIVDEDAGEASFSTLAAKIRANEEDDLTGGTERINGGRNGLDDRRRLLMRAATIWTG